MIGRERERVFLHEELGRAQAGDGRLVLLGGEAGIGKTTLAREAVREASERGFAVLTGSAHDLTAAPPYGPWLDLALGYDPAPGLPPLPAAFAGGQLAGVDSQAALFADTLAFVAALAARGPLLVLLEDLHWADAPSLELLRFLAARDRRLPVCFLVTYRVDELTRRHPLYQQLPGLIRAGEGLRLDLKRLEPAAMQGLVRAHYRLPPEDVARLCGYLDRHAEGNPFFALELMRALQDEGLLAAAGSGACLGPIDRFVLPNLLRQVIDGRLDRLGEALRDPLSIAAVIGSDVWLDVWAAVAGLPEAELLAIVERATEANLLVADRTGARAHFVHALTRASLYESIFPPRRRAWHRAVADALIARPPIDPDAVGFHLAQAGDDRAAAWLTRAGERAQRAYTWLLAAERYEAAAEALAGQAGTARERGWLLYRAGRMLRLGDAALGQAQMASARELADAAADPLLAGDAHYSFGLLQMYCNECAAGIAEMDAGITELERYPPGALVGDAAVALAMADSLPRHEQDADADVQSSAELHRLTGLHHRRGGLAWFYAAGGCFADARRVGEAFVAGGRLLDRPNTMVRSAIAHAQQGLGFVYALDGRVVEARAAFTEAREIYAAIDHHGVIALCCLSELAAVAIPHAADDPDYRRRVAAEAVAAYETAGGAMPPGLDSAICRLPVLEIDGRWDEAVLVIEESPPFATGFFRAGLVSTAARIATARGDHAGARRWIAEWFPAGPEEAVGRRLYRPSLAHQLVAAELALAEGDAEAARAWLTAHDAWTAWADDPTIGGAEGALGWAGLHAHAGDSAAAVAEAERALALASAPRQPLVWLRAQRLLGELATGVRDFGAADERLALALTMAERCEAPYEIGLTHLALTELGRSRGEPDAAVRHAADARARLVPLGAAPALRRLDAIRLDDSGAERLPFGLSPREAEVLRLVATGLTDAAAAERLFISPRTVSQHLRSVYAKLDVSSRAAATRVAIEHGVA